MPGRGWRYKFEFQGKPYSGQWFETKAEARAEREAHRKRLKESSAAEQPEWDFASIAVDYLEEAQRKFQPKTWGTRGMHINASWTTPATCSGPR